jgi:hypothetical protein
MSESFDGPNDSNELNDLSGSATRTIDAHVAQW